MIRFPLFEHLKVDGYGLYPGTQDTPGLKADFESGLTLVLGANGLGKSTLVLLLYRMCTGPNDIQGLTPGALGNRQFKMGSISTSDRRAFASRVNDSAAHATARLRFRVGETTLVVGRSLRTLALTELQVDGQPRMLNEDAYHDALLDATGLTSFPDWILVLRYLTFYFEDRRSLVWDASAQHQILRLLFLPPNESAKWTNLEADALRIDSHVRNISALLHREEASISRAEQTTLIRPEVEARINDLGLQQDRDQADFERVQEMLLDIEAERQGARLEALRAAEDREAIYREIEHRRLIDLEAAFPSKSESAGYILGYLLASQTCLACGNDAPEAAELLWRRVDEHRCIVCDSAIERPDSLAPDVNLEELNHALRAREDRLEEATKRRSEAEATYRSAVAQLAQLESAIANRSAELNHLVKQLPAGSQQVHERRKEYNALSASLEVRRAELAVAQHTFKAFVEQKKQTIFSFREQVKDTFKAYAKDFLLGTCDLIWQSRKTKVGQSGDTIDFGTFAVDMSASDSGLLVRRTGAGEVSESQREFIDLAFRMALMRVAGVGGRGSLVVDAPESSLDAVFAPRAAQVLMRFGNPDAGNRLVITSNLVDGELIPTLLRLAGVNEQDDSRVVDLFQIAYPTAAVRELRSEYNDALVRVFEGRSQ
ncbi:hypothetical protein [Micromonospora sp. NPDC092111]|uniref:hypothetical protein n=1 Tax=Micromonospora sp. NPDC092111 TaxID=3364289 RepID=UPI00382BB253